MQSADHAKLKFYGRIYKLNITFAGQNQKHYESCLDYTAAVILFSWAVAFFEYCAQVPANRIGFIDNGGPFNLMQLKVIQEVISLTVFTLVAMVMFKGQALQWNHFAAFFCLIMAVFFVFLK